MTVSRRARFPAFLSSLLFTFACADCGVPGSDGGPLDDGGAGEDPSDGGNSPHDAGASDAGPGDAGPGGLPPFQYATACDLNTGAGAAALGVEDAFPGLTFDNPLFMTPWPGSSRLFVIEQGGKIFWFDQNDPTATLTEFLDLSGVLESGGEKGLLGLAFHPDVNSNNTFYVSYTKREGVDLYSIISRFTTSSASTDVGDASSEYEILRVYQPYGNHNGGMIAFGPDGYLYIGLGDGGDGGDPLGHGQDTTTLLGSMLRIDVDNEDGAKRYSIPAGNPFADDVSGNQPEIFAWGLRNPWRWSFNRQSGDLWIADVGQGTWEEVNFIPASTLASGLELNFGWNIFEGSACYEPPSGAADCSQVSGTYSPEVVYHHDEGVSITGGYAYNGLAMPQHTGKYFYGDYLSRSVWLYDPATQSGHEAPAFTAPQSISSFAEDDAGELYLLGYAGDGRIWRVVDNGSAPSDPPPTLSATGCFTSLATLAPAPGVVPYDVNLSLWSDGAEKERWLVLPEGGKIDFDDTGKWQFPAGTVFIKHFAMDTTANDPATRVRLETRFIVVEPSGVRGFTYRWRDDGSDADLLSDADTRALELTLEPGGTPVSYTWNFPGPGQCLQCHTTASGGVLGHETAQLNRENTYGDVVINQMNALAMWELFGTPPAADPQLYERFPALDDDLADTSARARAWLHVNCAHCHLPGGPTGRNVDLRYTTSLAEMNACDIYPQGPTFGLEDPRIIKPGDPDASLLYYRDNNATGRMPPLGTTIVDDEAGAVQREWIEGLEGCTE